MDSPKKNMFISPVDSRNFYNTPIACNHVLRNKYDAIFMTGKLKLTIYQFYVRFVTDNEFSYYYYLVIDKFDNNTTSNNKKYTIAFKPNLKQVIKKDNKTTDYEYEYIYNALYNEKSENYGKDFKITVIADNGKELPFYLELEYSLLTN
jgi:hypothetical protein